jgi:two-component system cell cycle response regulator DivK
MITILIAEDDAASLELVRDALESPEYRILESSNGQDALLQVKTESPDLVLLDIQMPRLSGFEVLLAIHNLNPPATCSVLALTALAMDADRERILASGFDGYIAKPISISDLREKVRQVLNLRSRSASHEL